jgi:hypothetical protein
MRKLSKRVEPILLLVLIGIALAAAPAPGEEATADRDLPRTSSGKPDLSGNYDLASLTPLQRDPKFKVEDPDYTAPYSGELTWPRTTERLFEYACHEGNYSLGNILRGARILEILRGARILERETLAKRTAAQASQQ